MGGASGRAGDPSIGGEPLLHPIGDSVSDSCSVNSKPAKQRSRLHHVANVLQFKPNLSCSETSPSSLDFYGDQPSLYPILKLPYCFYPRGKSRRACVKRFAKCASWRTSLLSRTKWYVQLHLCRLYTHTDNDIVPVDPYCSHELVVYLQSTAKLLEVCQTVFSCGIVRDVTSSVASKSFDHQLWLISVSSRVYPHL